MGEKKISTTVYLEAAQVVKLQALRKATKVPVAEHIRAALDAYLKAPTLKGVKDEH